jgi:hypothetical protein
LIGNELNHCFNSKRTSGIIDRELEDDQSGGPKTDPATVVKFKRFALEELGF